MTEAKRFEIQSSSGAWTKKHKVIMTEEISKHIKTGRLTDWTSAQSSAIYNYKCVMGCQKRSHWFSRTCQSVFGLAGITFRY